jgi:hypothetical protein
MERRAEPIGWIERKRFKCGTDWERKKESK